MHYIITGGAGHTARPIAEGLLQAGHRVTVLGRNAQNLAPLVAAGAQAAIGSLEDPAFVTQAFAGADAAYLVIPPNFVADDFRAYQHLVADNLVAALQANSVSKAVVLSSVGAHMGTGAGPVDGLAYLENAITTQLPQTDAVFLRPSYFYYNLFQQVGLLKQAGIMGGNYNSGSSPMPLVATEDIAAEALHWLLPLQFSGKQAVYVASDEVTTDAIAAALGGAVGKPETPWITFSDEDALAGMLQAGLKPAMAHDYVTMGQAMRQGHMNADYLANRPARMGKVKLADFARAFAQAYEANA